MTTRLTVAMLQQIIGCCVAATSGGLEDHPEYEGDGNGEPLQADQKRFDDTLKAIRWANEQLARRGRDANERRFKLN